MTGTLARTETPLIARDDAHTSVVWPLLSGTTRLVLVTGPAGIGRTALLNEVRDTLEHRRVRTADVPLLRADRNRPQAVVARVKEELARWSRPPVLFVDDLHRLNHDVLRALLDALPQLATCVVGSYRTPVRLERTDVEETLKSSALTEIVPLTPLNRAEVSLMFTGLLNVSADPELVRRLHHDSRGFPGLVDLAYLVDDHAAPATATPPSNGSGCSARRPGGPPRRWRSCTPWAKQPKNSSATPARCRYSRPKGC